MNDLKFAFRQLLKNPGFTTVAVLTLALSIGSISAIFSFINAVLLRSLPYPSPDELVQVWTSNKRSGYDKMSISIPDFMDWKAQCRSFRHLAFYRSAFLNLSGQDRPQRVQVARVSIEFFDALQVSPSRGRTLLPTENQPGNDNSVRLSHGIWVREFGADSGILDKEIRLDGKKYRVVGVMPGQFGFPKGAELWLPYAATQEQLFARRFDLFEQVIGRLADGASVKDAQAELETIAVRLEQEYPKTNLGRRFSVVSLREELVGSIRPALLILFAATGFVLLIGCSNVANLLLSRAVTRRKELAMRTALGASRLRLFRQLLTESVLLSLTGGAVGVLVGFWAMESIRLLVPADIPAIRETKLDGTVLLFTFGISVFSGILFGVWPAREAFRLDWTESLKDGNTGSLGTVWRSRSRSVLIVTEIALAVVLLVGAGLLSKSLLKLQNVSPGFNPRNLYAAQIILPWEKYHVERKDSEFFRQLMDRVATLPGAEKTAAARALPFGGGGVGVWFALTGEGTTPGEEWGTGLNFVTTNFFDVMEMPIVRGRKFGPEDTMTSPRVVIVNEALAKRYFPNGDPLGKRILIEAQGNDPFTIVGIVASARQVALSKPPGAEVFLLYQQRNETRMWLVIRGGPQVKRLEPEIAKIVQSLDTDQAIGGLKPLETLIDESASLPRFRTLLLNLFALAAILLACVGIYGVISYSVSQRTRELGLRMALGAESKNILRLVLSQATRLSVLGIVFGLVAALGLTRILANMLFEISPSDPLPFLPTALMVFAMSVLACYLPARRAARIHPMVALRYE